MLEISDTSRVDAQSPTPVTISTNVLLIEILRAATPVLPTLLAGRDVEPSASRRQLIVHQAQDVPRGLDTLAEGGIDAVILDVSPLKTNGLKPLYQLLEADPGIPVVVVSDVNDSAQALEAISAGTQDYLVWDQLTPEQLLRSLDYAMERYQLLRKLSLTDDLTKLRNRRGFLTVAEQQLKLARAHRVEASLLLAFVDIDCLKQINDLFGHSVGSAAICDAAETLRSTFREVDVIGRIGGDEFGILVVDAGEDDANAILSRFNANVQAVNDRGNNPYLLSLTIGMIPVDPNSDETIEDLVARADAAMYEQKRHRGPCQQQTRVLSAQKSDHPNLSSEY